MVDSYLHLVLVPYMEASAYETLARKGIAQTLSAAVAVPWQPVLSPTFLLLRAKRSLT